MPVAFPNSLLLLLNPMLLIPIEVVVGEGVINVGVEEPTFCILLGPGAMPVNPDRVVRPSTRFKACCQDKYYLISRMNHLH